MILLHMVVLISTWVIIRGYRNCHIGQWTYLKLNISEGPISTIHKPQSLCYLIGFSYDQLSRIIIIIEGVHRYEWQMRDARDSGSVSTGLPFKYTITTLSTTLMYIIISFTGGYDSTSTRKYKECTIPLPQPCADRHSHRS